MALLPWLPWLVTWDAGRVPGEHHNCIVPSWYETQDNSSRPAETNESGTETRGLKRFCDDTNVTTIHGTCKGRTGQATFMRYTTTPPFTSPLLLDPVHP